MSETKSERFRRLAEKRTNAAIEHIRVIGNLANRSAYEYTDEDVAQLFKALNEAVRTCRAKFDDRAMRRFQLPDRGGN